VFVEKGKEKPSEDSVEKLKDKSLSLVVQFRNGELKTLSLPGLEEIKSNNHLLGNRKEL